MQLSLQSKAINTANIVMMMFILIGGCGELNDPLIAEEFRENNSKMECVLGLVRITIARV